MPKPIKPQSPHHPTYIPHHHKNTNQHLDNESSYKAKEYLDKTFQSKNLKILTTPTKK